jgi:2-oxoisovalerate dehydrogenase E1 component alpha subunit
LEQYRGDGIASRGIGYGIETLRVDGNDILAVYLATKVAREISLKGNRPVLIEAMSYRVSHHSTSDDSFAYRAKSDVEEWKRRDNPITRFVFLYQPLFLFQLKQCHRFRKYLEAAEWWSNDEEVSFRTQIRKDILKAFAKAEKEKKPAVREAFSDMFSQPTLELLEQQAKLKEVVERYPDEYSLEDFDGGNAGL